MEEGDTEDELVGAGEEGLVELQHYRSVGLAHVWAPSVGWGEYGK